MPNPHHIGEILIGTEERNVWVPQSAWWAFCDRLTQGETPPQRLNSLRALFNQYIDPQLHDGSNETLEWFDAAFMQARFVYPEGSLDIVDVEPAMLRFPTTTTTIERKPTPAPSRRKRHHVKPGWKTSEFWLSTAAMVVGLLIASGVVGDGTAFAKVLALASSTLAQLGYTFSRGAVKKAAALPDPAPKALPAPE